MKILSVLLVSAFAFFLGACAADRPLIPDEQYDAMHPPAPHSPDPTGNVPSQRSNPSGGY